MEQIWAPWRIKYILSEKPRGCIFCDKPKENNDAANFILFRGQKNFVILNAYPYNPGHLLIVPYRHIASLEGLTDDELVEHFQMVRSSTRIMRETFKTEPPVVMGCAYIGDGKYTDVVKNLGRNWEIWQEAEGV